MFGLERAGAIQSAAQVQQRAEIDRKVDTKRVRAQTAVKPSNQAVLNNIRVLQREGKILVGEDFTPLAPEPLQFEPMVEGSAFQKRSQSVSGCRTKRELMSKRRSAAVAELEAAYGDLQQKRIHDSTFDLQSRN